MSGGIGVGGTGVVWIWIGGVNWVTVAWGKLGVKVVFWIIGAVFDW